MDLPEAFDRIRAFAFDMDGVLTDGTLWIQADGQWVRRMHIRDGYALQLAIRKGYPVCVVSGSDAPPVTARLNALGIRDVFMQAGDKERCLAEFMQSHGLSSEQVLFMGDDVPDMRVMRMAGLSACPCDAAQDVRNIAAYISPVSGGAGCVRDVIERVLRLHGDWSDDMTTRSL